MTKEQIKELFDAAMKVSNLATQAEVLLRHKFPPFLDNALVELSLVLNRFEPIIKEGLK